MLYPKTVLIAILAACASAGAPMEKPDYSTGLETTLPANYKPEQQEDYSTGLETTLPADYQPDQPDYQDEQEQPEYKEEQPEYNDEDGDDYDNDMEEEQPPSKPDTCQGKAKSLNMWDLAVGQLMAHDADKTLRCDQQNPQCAEHKENGWFDLSTVLINTNVPGNPEYECAQIREGGDPRNRENFALHAVCSSIGRRYCDRIENDGWSKEQAYEDVMSVYKVWINELYEKMAGIKMDQSWDQDCEFRLQENLAWRSGHVMLPGMVRARGEMTPTMRVARDGRWPRRELEQMPSKHIDGKFDEAFLRLVRDPSQPQNTFSLLDLDTSFGVQFKTREQFGYYLKELDHWGCYEPSSLVWKRVKDFFHRGLYCPLKKENWRKFNPIYVPREWNGQPLTEPNWDDDQEQPDYEEEEDTYEEEPEQDYEEEEEEEEQDYEQEEPEQEYEEEEEEPEYEEPTTTKQASTTYKPEETTTEEPYKPETTTEKPKETTTTMKPYQPEPTYAHIKYDKRVTLFDLGVLQLAAHDLFNVDRRASIEFENGRLDLSTLFKNSREGMEPLTCKNILIGGERRNGENVLIRSVAQILGKEYCKAILVDGWKSRRAYFKVLRMYHEWFNDVWKRLFDEPLLQPRHTDYDDCDATMAENLAFRTLHVLLPEDVKMPDGSGLKFPVHIQGTFTEEYMRSQWSKVLDGNFDPKFTAITFPGSGRVIDLLEADQSFGIQFGVERRFKEDLLSELRENGRYMKQSWLMKTLRKLYLKGLYCMLEDPDWHKVPKAEWYIQKQQENNHANEPANWD